MILKASARFQIRDFYRLNSHLFSKKASWLTHLRKLVAKFCEGRTSQTTDFINDKLRHAIGIEGHGPTGMLRCGVTTNTRLQWYSGVLYFLINTNSTVEDAKAFCVWPVNKLVAMTFHSRFGKLRPNVYLEIKIRTVQNI